MGMNESKTKTRTEVLNSVSVDSISKISGTMSSSSDQTSSLIIDGISGGSKIKGVTQSNASKINMDALMTQSASANLKADLKSKLEEAVKTNQNALGYSVSTVDVSGVVSNVVDINITNDSLSQLSADIKQKNTTMITNVSDSSEIGAVNQSNTSSAVIKFVSKMSNDVISKLKAAGATDVDSETDQTNPVTKAIDSFMDFIKTLGLAPMIMIFLVIVLVIGGFGYVIVKMFSSGSSSHPENPQPAKVEI